MRANRVNGTASGRDGRICFLIVDDHPHGREGMRDILEAEPRFAVIGEAASGEKRWRRCGGCGRTLR